MFSTHNESNARFKSFLWQNFCGFFSITMPPWPVVVTGVAHCRRGGGVAEESRRWVVEPSGAVSYWAFSVGPIESGPILQGRWAGPARQAHQARRPTLQYCSTGIFHRESSKSTRGGGPRGIPPITARHVWDPRRQVGPTLAVPVRPAFPKPTTLQRPS